MAAYDVDHNSQLVDTLSAYLDAFGDVAKTAQAMHVHPNTLRYRLRRITEVSGLDLSNPRCWPVALGSALALFAFPHVLMVVFSAMSKQETPDRPTGSSAHRLVLKARPHRPTSDDRGEDER
ncbi:PucR family transcriptional regulator [Saccharopolyspora sp. 5N102]|uniref:PucR family transcriptional regulator n=1 Tax=Saccharopolyspora sp. 5N102 TaxID=3375155 RepID=UPI00379BBCAA